MKLKVGVVGLGFMGFAHARVYKKLEECRLIGVYDIDPEKKRLAKTYHYKFFEDLKSLLKEELDLISICTPTSEHRGVAIEALEKGTHVLVEKPLSTDLKSGREMVEKSVKIGRLLAVGYLERFNPAVGKLVGEVDLSQIFSTLALRFGPSPPTKKDIGVLLDLGTHEIDILNYLTRTQPEPIYTFVSSKSNSVFEDYAYISLKYGHISSHIEASWLPTYKLRLIHFYGNDRFYTLNYAQQNLKSYKASKEGKIGHGSWRDILRLSRNVEKEFPVSPTEPLELELKRFTESIRNGEVLDPICEGKEALLVLKIVEKALYKLKKGKN